MRALTMLGILLLLGGCADMVQVSFTDERGYDRSFAIYGARTGEMALVVLGNPTADSPAALEASVAAALRGTHPDHRVVFVPAASPEAKGYRTVVLFGPGDVNGICGMTAGGQAAAVRQQAAAAFCFDDRMFSYAQGRMPAVANAGDPTLHRMVKFLGLGIFSPRRSDELGCNRYSDC
jgi:hypothetical protein